LLDGEPAETQAAPEEGARVEHVFVGAHCFFLLDGREHEMLDTTYAPGTREAASGASGRISAPMNGRIVTLPVCRGDRVRAGQLVMVLEAMKMEHSIVAPRDGTVLDVFAAVGEQVAPGRALMEIAEAEV
jgi:geranyl-CoA carboxylase alpha subunit